ncbi:MAG: phosphoenolpyruvate--protein phosphotransferase [Waddliaceae bacterium]
MKIAQKEVFLKGSPISKGIAIGKTFFFNLLEDSIPEYQIDDKEIKKEILRYRKAVENTRNEIHALQCKLKNEKILEGASILDASLQMLADPLLTTYIESQIERVKKNVEFIFSLTINEYQEKFQSMNDPYIKERFKDVQDLSKRIMAHLRKTVKLSLNDLPPNSIVFSKELSAAEIAEADIHQVAGLVTELGGTTSHAAIVAKARGIPFVSSVDFSQIDFELIKQNVIVDGQNGDVVIAANKETITHYQTIKKLMIAKREDLESRCALPSETIDGFKVVLSANIDMENELDLLHQYGGSGVGLLRSEYICHPAHIIPSEEEQFQIYSRMVQKMKGLPIVIRIFDLGGDKVEINGKKFKEGNPFLGCRAIRFLLRERNLFIQQIRAILRASVYGDVRIMFPMISSLPELLSAKQVVYEVQEQLRKEKIPAADSILIGCMIEVPSAAIISDLLAKECDFLSIGTNDLVQYSLAVDRDNHEVASHYEPTDPSVLRLIKQVVIQANLHGIPLSICGEIAADPRFTPLLLGLGIKALSVAPRHLPIVRDAVRQITALSAFKLADHVLTLSTAKEIKDLLDREQLSN